MTKKRKVKNVGKRNIKKIEEQMSKFWIFARLRLVVKYIIILYICMGVIYLAGPYYMNIVLNHFDGIMYVDKFCDNVLGIQEKRRYNEWNMF